MIALEDIDPRLLAAMVAAVQSYSEEENTSSLSEQGLRRLKPWRLLPWQSLGTGPHRKDIGWRIYG